MITYFIGVLLAYGVIRTDHRLPLAIRSVADDDEEVLIYEIIFSLLSWLFLLLYGASVLRGK